MRVLIASLGVLVALSCQQPETYTKDEINAFLDDIEARVERDVTILLRQDNEKLVAQRAAFDQQLSAHISDVMVENLEQYATALCNLAHLLDNVRVSLHYVHNHLEGAEEALLASQNFLEHGVPVEAYQSLDGNPCEIGPDGKWSIKEW